ncbi:GNAT family N-acetyltransferase [Psychrilyobacter atlanticus]|uniref:GNAT family N-acetyltransferase n=1 Tax=Psychrilyobacter atlanticus TaxID=271091 RepID=UPI0004166AE3|nr:GNAT family N-acetyltransferase [Psychrilyobacter atlanticus]
MKIKKIEKETLKDYLGLKKIIVDYFKYIYRGDILSGKKYNFEDHGEHVMSLVTEDNDTNMMVASENGIILGFIMYDRYNFKKTVTGRICELYVDPNARNTNIGSKLVTLVEEELATKSYYITADKDAVNFWKKNGYHHIDETADNGNRIFIKNL